MKQQDKTEIFEKTSIPKAMMLLSIPTVISSLVMVIYNMTDTWFVGMLNSSVQTAAVTLAGPVLLAFNAVNNLFGVGSSSMMGRALGRKDYDTVKRSSSFGIWAAILFAALFSVFFTLFQTPLLEILGASNENVSATMDYLYWTVSLGAVPAILNVVMACLVRTEGASLHASIGTMSGCILNIILDPFFVLPSGLNMGAAGAGMATFIANCFACLYFFVLLFVRRKSTYVCIHPKKAVPKAAVVRGVFSVGIPAAIQNLLNVTGMTILNNFTSAFGSEAVAAMGIAYKIYMVPMQVSWGVMQGIMPLISYNYGSQNYKRAKKTVFSAAKLSVGFLIVILILFQFTASDLVRTFIDNDHIVQYGTKLLRGMCLALPFLATDFLAVGTFQSCGKGFLSLLFALLRKVVLEIPALIILNHFFPLYGLAYAQFSSEVVLSVAAVIVVIRMFAKLEAKKMTLPTAHRM